MMETAARWSRGQLGGDALDAPFPVLIASAEDHKAATLVPRLIAAGADLALIFFMETITNGIPAGVSIPLDLPSLRARMRDVGARALLFDPLVAHLPADANSWRDQDVRQALAPLAALAEETAAVVCGSMHLNKAQGVREALVRMGASIAFPAAARSVFLVAPDPDDASVFVLAHAKNNLAPLAASVRFRIEGREIDGPISTSGIAWIGEAPGLRADDLLVTEEPDERTARVEATDWLRETLRDGPRPASALLREAAGVGLRERTLRRAKSLLAVRSSKQGFTGDWEWALPDEGGHVEGGQSPYISQRGSLREKESLELLLHKDSYEDGQPQF